MPSSQAPTTVSARSRLRKRLKGFLGDSARIIYRGFAIKHVDLVAIKNGDFVEFVLEFHIFHGIHCGVSSGNLTVCELENHHS